MSFMKQSGKKNDKGIVGRRVVKSNVLAGNYLKVNSISLTVTRNLRK